MYPEYDKINNFLQEANLVMQGSRSFKSIYELIIKRNAKAKYAIYVNDNSKIASYPYKKMDKNVHAFASYISKNIDKSNIGKIIGLKMANSPHWGEAFYACLMAGFKVLLIDAKASVNGTNNLLKQTAAVAIIADDTNNYEVKKLGAAHLLEAKEEDFEPSWEDEVIYCSSGTTGDVKMMVFNGENICHQICASLDMPKETKDIMYPKKYGKINILAMVPFHHIFGFVAVFLWYTYYGKTLVFPNGNTPSSILYMCQKAGVTHVYSVPLFWDAIAQNVVRKAALEGKEKEDLLNKMIKFNLGEIDKNEAGLAGSNVAKNVVQKKLLGNKVRYCISGGGYLNQDTARIINGIGYPLYDGFGMTEVGVTSVELSKDVNERLKGTIGKPLYGVSYKLKNEENGQGELVIKSPTIHIKEIIGGEIKPTEFDEEGYFPTGDIATVTEDGKYIIKGRIKDIIINSDGENIFPDEIEIFFKDLPHITNVCVLGVKAGNSTNQNVVLVLEVDNSVNEEELKNIQDKIKEISKDLPHKIAISNIYLAMKKLPMANNMKVKRFVVRKAIEEGSQEYIDITKKKENKSFEGFDQEVINSILIRMRKIFSKILILPEFKINDDGHWINDLGGDSMSYVELIQKVESEFGVKIPEEQYGQLTNINEFTYQVALLKQGK